MLQEYALIFLPNGNGFWNENVKKNMFKLHQNEARKREYNMVEPVERP